MKHLFTPLMIALLAIPVASLADECELYEIDFKAQKDSTSQYEVTCGEVDDAQWTVRETSGGTCMLTTGQIELNGTDGDMVSTPISIEILNAASTTSCDDWIKIQYQVDGGEWVTQDSINACDMDPFVFNYDFNVECSDTSKLAVRVIMSVDDNSGAASSEKLRIRDGGICISEPMTVLPVNLKYFTAEPQENKTAIAWATATEKNSSYFVVERSTDGKNFESITTIPAAGNSITESHYETYDYDMPYGTVYYRLKQTDAAGNEIYSQVASVKNNVAIPENFLVFPNPTDNGTFNISVKGVEDEEVFVVLFDPMGKEVFSKVILQENENVLTAIDPQQRLSPGIYLVVGSSDNNLYQQKLVVR